MTALASFGPVEQRYVSEARQMPALSLGVHIPLVWLAIAFRRVRTGRSGLLQPGSATAGHPPDAT
jgi:hypothetical protein